MSEQPNQPHDKQCHDSVDSCQPVDIVDIQNWPMEPRGEGDYESEESEYLVDIDTHHSILVIARSVDEAASKALGPLADDQTTVAHDVHVCVHSGISSNECDHEDDEEEHRD